MKKREWDFLAPSSRTLTDDPLLSIILIMVIGTAIWAVAPEQFADWFPAAVFVSGLLIVLGEFLMKWLRKERK